MSTIHTIWQNIDLNVEDYAEFLAEEHPEITDEWEKFRLVSELNDSYLNDERANLNIDVDSGRILVIAELGLWDGKHYGCNVIEGNITNCLRTDCDYAHWYVDGHGQMRCTAIHHDGRNHYLYREIKPGVSDNALEKLIDKIISRDVWDRDMSYYTRKLGPYIQKVYGW